MCHLAPLFQNESRGGVKPFIYENEFDLHENEPSLGREHFT